MTSTSPVTETELKEKAVAPRVTEVDLLANIAEVTYLQHKLLTICVMELRNGFLVTGESACADAANFDRYIGQRISYVNAKAKIWAFMGYELRSKLAGNQ